MFIMFTDGSNIQFTIPTHCRPVLLSFPLSVRTVHVSVLVDNPAVRVLENDCSSNIEPFHIVTCVLYICKIKNKCMKL